MAVNKLEGDQYMFGRESRVCSYLAKFGSTAAVYAAVILLGTAYLTSAQTGRENRIATEEKLAALKKLAKKGDNHARYTLGRAYMAGQMGLKEDSNQAFFWLNEAGVDNHAAAQFDLAVCYEQGIGTEEDKELAVEFYLKAGEQGIENAYTHSGLLLKALGRPDAAAKSFRLGAGRRNPVALREYGRALIYGLGVAADVPGAISFLEHAAQTGDAEANLLLAEVYTGNYGGVPQSPKKMIHHLWEAANRNFAPAQSKLGYCYEEGLGVAKDTEVAVKWYMKAAQSGYPTAMINLASCYDLGKGVAMSKPEAFKWYKKAADQDFPLGHYNVGICYATGTGVEVDDVRALEYLTKAAELGEATAQFNLGVIYEKGIGTDPNPENAFYWYGMCAAQDDSRGLRALAACYVKGLGTPVDESKATAYFRKATDLNTERAIPIFETSK